MDNGGEYFPTKFPNYLEEKGITHGFAIPHPPGNRDERRNGQLSTLDDPALQHYRTSIGRKPQRISTAA